ncbi:hypothetical protein GCM10009792_23020 [Microcella alkalica]|uniref:Transcriptional regulator with XRE-family HTH domain n=1 Tax=Microcella alkalica TaxID=355930 RepID=A0A839EAY9_9MICO|nr:helix-turn-helix domain-containing protein [Microcella alkalica]MBA8846878.1 transcriptional regulator with XRE-family HTH domain [Microcella alkalica]
MIQPARTLLRARRSAGLSQAALARRSAIAQSTISRIESGALDPTWSTMQALLEATGWEVNAAAGPESDLIAPETAARSIATQLGHGNIDAAARDLTESVGRLIRYLDEHPGVEPPAWAVAAPKTADLPMMWSTFLATAFAYALQSTGRAVSPWMLAVPALPDETALGDEPSERFREWLRARTPEVFRQKNLLSRAEDWRIA